MHPLLFWFPKSIPFLKLGETIYDPTFKIKKMTGFQAGLASGWQKKLKNFQKERQSAVKRWLRLLPHSFIPAGVMFNKVSSILRFPIKSETEEKARQILQQSANTGLGISITYPDAINGIKPLAKYFKGRNFPGARKAVRQTLTLPVNGFIKNQDQKKILKVITGG
jgi:perosamine synthetase